MLFVPGGGHNLATIQSNGAGRPQGAQGTAVTPGVGSKGSWAQAIASLALDTFGLLICINSNVASAASRNSVVDIGIGGSGSEIVLIPDLIGGNASGYNTGGGLWYYFPVFIPAGTRIAVRSQGSVATAFQVFIQALQEPADPAMMKCASFVEALGMTLPQGTAVTAGTTSEGSWTLLGALTKPCWWFQLGVQITSADTAHNANCYHLDLASGNGSNFDMILESLLFQTTTGEAGSTSLIMASCERPVPAGTNIYARAQCSGTVESLFVAGYGAGG